MLNLAVVASSSPVVRDVPKPMASEAPKESISTMLGLWRSSPRFTSGDHMTPELTMPITLERS